MVNKIMFSCGEVSGDLNTAEVIKELYKLDSKLEIFGFGGEKCRQAGMKIYLNLTSYNTVGLIESLKFIKIYNKAWKYAKKILKEEKPNVLVLVNNQGFNLHLAKFARKQNIPTIYYFAPQIWLWGGWKGRNIAKLITHIIAVYKQEEEIYKRVDAQVTFVGHPIFDICKVSLSKEEIIEKFGLCQNFPVIGLFPGSRLQEIENLLPIFIKAAHKIKQVIPSVQFLLTISSPLYKEKIENMIREDKNIKLINGYSHEVICISDLIIASSGSITLEAAYFNTPMIITYKISKITFFIASLLTKYKFIALPNILVNKEIIPELLQNRITPENIKNLSLKILKDKEILKKIKTNLQEVINSLKKENAVKNTAEIIFSYAKKNVF